MAYNKLAVIKAVYYEPLILTAKKGKVKMAYYQYKRISTNHQSLVRQDVALENYCKENDIVVPEDNIYSDIITGKTTKRVNYQIMKSKLQKDDVLILLDLDRLGRTWDIIKSEWEELTNMGVYIIIVNCPLINVMPDSKGEISVDKRLIQQMMFTLLCYLSQKEVEKISMRTKEALKAKKEQGVELGRPKTISDEVRQKVISLKGTMNYRDIADELGISIATVSRIIKGGQ